MESEVSRRGVHQWDIKAEFPQQFLGSCFVSNANIKMPKKAFRRSHHELPLSHKTHTFENIRCQSSKGKRNYFIDNIIKRLKR